MDLKQTDCEATGNLIRRSLIKEQVMPDSIVYMGMLKSYKALHFNDVRHPVSITQGSPPSRGNDIRGECFGTKPQSMKGNWLAHLDWILRLAGDA